MQVFLVSCHHQQSQDHRLGIMISFTLISLWDLLDILIMLHCLQKCSVAYYNVNLSFSHLLKIRVYPVSRFQLSLTCCFCQFFYRNPFSIFSDKKHPIALVKLPVSIELRISPVPFSLNALVYAHVNVGVFTRTPFTLSRLVYSTLQRVDGATVDVWLYIPGIKVGQNWSLFFLFDNFWRRWL